MKPSERDPVLYLEDIILSMERVQEYISGFAFAELLALFTCEHGRPHEGDYDRSGRAFAQEVEEIPWRHFGGAQGIDLHRLDRGDCGVTTGQCFLEGFNSEIHFWLFERPGLASEHDNLCSRFINSECLFGEGRAYGGVKFGLNGRRKTGKAKPRSSARPHYNKDEKNV